MEVLSLRDSLQKIQPDFAYHILYLEMRVQNQNESERIDVSQISKLMELYMIGVEVLESKSDKRFAYFYKKIQSMMLKKQIVQQLHRATGITIESGTIDEIKKAQLGTKKNQHNMQIFFNQGQCDGKRMKQIINNAERKLQRFSGKVDNVIANQQNNLDERIHQRRLRSDASGSIKKIMFGKENRGQGQEPRSPIRDTRMEYFNESDLPKKRKSSAEKVKPKRDYTYY